MSGKSRAAHGTIVAYLALFVALSGTGAYAVDKIGSGGIKNNAIKTRHIAGGEVRSADIGAGAVNGAKVANNSLTSADLNDEELGIGVGLVTGRAPGPDAEAIRFVAPAGTTTVTLTTFDEAALLSPPVPTEVADFTVSAAVEPGDFLTVTLMVDGLASSLACTIGGPDTSCVDDEDTEVLAAGSRIAVRIQLSGVPATDIRFGMTVSPLLG
ncbi:MAG TPA: hypothetical protein VD704_07360 [Gaiellaceae bacterium]|nr:hypothetical protein [Gaiellaceae bacterium]